MDRSDSGSSGSSDSEYVALGPRIRDVLASSRSDSSGFIPVSPRLESEGSNSPTSNASSNGSRRRGISTGAPRRSTRRLGFGEMAMIVEEAVGALIPPPRTLRSATAALRQEERKRAAKEAHEKMAKRITKRRTDGG